MGKSLVVVESPAKAKTINKYLGNDFKVMASMGHVRDLPTNRLGVHVDEEFEPDYIIMPSKKKVISELKSEAKKADAIYLAPDPDREGEAICWHLEASIVPEGTPVHRVQFNEITKKAILEAITHPSQTDMNRVDAQQARRILDRLVGYMISPVLWKKVKRGISAGRVQSVALRMIVEREYEILAFDPIEYWTFAAVLEGGLKPIFNARMVKWEGENIRLGNKETKRTIGGQEEAREIEKTLRESDFTVAAVVRKAKKLNPPTPFTTSKLQQDASRSIGFSVKKTMTVAQRLYEGIEWEGEPTGLITYMRTDSTRISDEAMDSVRQFIEANYAPEYLPEKPRKAKQKDGIQDSHECIRPTNPELTPDTVAPFLDKDELKLYALIWKRFVASQMTPKKMDETLVEIEAGPGRFEAKGLVTTFAGFSILYTEQKPASESQDEAKSGELPPLNEGEILQVHELETKQNHTKPPPRFSEASLVKALEENGIGRPSTYASIIAVIQNRDYVEKREGRFHPSELGMVVIDLLTKSFPDLMDVKYTAHMEDKLDQVEAGHRTWRALLTDFYKGFEVELKDAEANMPNLKRGGLPTDLDCEVCDSPLVIKTGKYGQFLSCSNYPECTFAKKIKEVDPKTTKIAVLKGMIGQESEAQTSLNQECPQCGVGELVRKRGKFGEFIACTNYPDCKYIHKETIGVPCPKDSCGGEIYVKKSKKGKIFYTCTAYPNCDYVSWDKPLNEACPDCGASNLYEKQRKSQTSHYCKECKFVRDAVEESVATA